MPDETVIAIPHPEQLIVVEDVDTVLVVEEEIFEVIVTTPGPQGPPGGTIVEVEFTFYHKHVQAVPASVWNINHALGAEPNVTVVDSAGTQVEGEVEYLDADNVRLTFQSGFSGEAYLS